MEAGGLNLLAIRARGDAGLWDNERCLAEPQTG